MLVLGIDPGTATTGFGLVRETADGSLVALDYGVITTPAGMPLPERLLVLYQQIRDLMLLHHPDCGAVEKLYFQRNVTTAFAVGQARGVVLLAMAQEKMPVMEYSPLEVKQAVVGYGMAEKRQVQEMVKAILQLDKIPRPDDAADALAIAITYLHSARYLNAGM